MAHNPGSKYPTNPTMIEYDADSLVPSLRLERQRARRLWRQLHQRTGFQMEYLSREAVQGPAHLYHLAADIDASQESAFSQSMPEGLLAHRETLNPGHLLSHLIAGHRLQELSCQRSLGQTLGSS